MAKVRAAAGGSILLPKIVQAEFCASFRQAGPGAREGPLPVTVVPAGVELGSSYAPYPCPSLHIYQNYRWGPEGTASAGVRQTRLSPTLPFLTEPPGTRQAVPKPPSPQL